MFEQSTLSSGPAGKRIWATGIGITGEALLVGFAILAPMVWPQALPRIALFASLAAPVPSGVHPKPAAERPPVSHAAYRPQVFRDGALIAPPQIPDKVMMIIDPPSDVESGPGVVGGFDHAGPGGAGSGLLDSIMKTAGAPVPRPVLIETRKAAPPVAPPAVRQVKVGGEVKMATLIHRVEPEYPAIAKSARVSGVVELVGVIAVDGHIKELRVVSGHPLLASAALRAVSQWVYSPTTLNREAVEVVAPIIVTFRLN